MKKTYILNNLDCANCASKIERRVKKINKVKDASVNFSTLKLIVDFKHEEDEEEIKEAIIKLIKELEPDVEVTEEGTVSQEKGDKDELKGELVKIIVGTIFLIFGVIFKDTFMGNCLFAVSYIELSAEIFRKAYKNIKSGEIFDENFLMLIATIGAICIGEFFEAVLVMLLYQIGELLSDRAVNNSRNSISALITLKANHATKIIDENEVQVKPEELNIDDIIVIKPGEKIPVDSIVIEGTSEIDTSSMTGESIYSVANVNDKIISGTINVNGVLKAKVEKVYADSEVAKVLELLENSTNVKSKSEKFITKFSRYYTPIVIVLAVLLTLIPSLISGEIKYDYIYKSLSFLVVSCPCALVISIPLTYFSAIGFASSKGILVKGANFLDQFCNVKNMFFDKTGTITNGKFKVEKIILSDKEINENQENEFKKLIKVSEDYSNHPIALAIKEYAKDVDINDTNVKDVKDIPGYGVELSVNNNNILFGNLKLMKERKIEVKENEDNLNNGYTICFLAVNNEYKGCVLLADQIKDNSKKCIEDLKNAKINNLIILTGDNDGNALKVANELGINYYANLLPVDKLEKVNESKANGISAFTGDGINDAPVLMNADIGIAMGGIGSDIAIEAADIVIMNDDIYKIFDLFKISKFARKIVIENIFFSILIKIAILVLITLGFSNMISAIFADVGVTILTVINSMRVFKIK